MKSILDPTFRYTPSFSTDISKTFARIRSEMQRRTRPLLIAEGAKKRIVPLYPQRQG